MKPALFSRLGSLVEGAFGFCGFAAIGFESTFLFLQVDWDAVLVV